MPDKTNLSTADFVESEHGVGNDQLSPGQRSEVAQMEVGEDGRSASYTAVTVGYLPNDIEGDTRQGKIYGQLRDSDGNPVDDDTEIRLVKRFRDGTGVSGESEWFKAEGLDESRPDHMYRLRVTDGEDAKANRIRDGRVIAIEARHPSQSVQIDHTESRLVIPAYAFH